MQRISIIAAVQVPDRVIGQENWIPWSLPADLDYFRRLTLGGTVIMGRKTFEAIGAPLKQRFNIVVSKTLAVDKPLPENMAICKTIEEAKCLALRQHAYQPVFCIGGGSLYKAMMPICNNLYITEVDIPEVEGDTYFPEIDKSAWKTTFTGEWQNDCRHKYRMVNYAKRLPMVASGV